MVYMPLGKSVYQTINFLVSQQKHVLLVIKRILNNIRSYLVVKSLKFGPNLYLCPFFGCVSSECSGTACISDKY